MTSVIILFSNPGVLSEQAGFMHLQIHPLFLCQLWFILYGTYLVSGFCGANLFVFDVLDFFGVPATRFYPAFQTDPLSLCQLWFHTYIPGLQVWCLVISVVSSVVGDVLKFT